MNLTEGFGRIGIINCFWMLSSLSAIGQIGIISGTLASVSWTAYTAWKLFYEQFSYLEPTTPWAFSNTLAATNAAFEWLGFFFLWVIGLAVTFFVPFGLIVGIGAGIGWVVSGFQQND